VSSSTLSYIPKQVNNSDPAFCYSGLQKEEPPTDEKIIISEPGREDGLDGIVCVESQ